MAVWTILYGKLIYNKSLFYLLFIILDVFILVLTDIIFLWDFISFLLKFSNFFYLSEVIWSFFSEDLSLLNTHDSLFLGNDERCNASQDEKNFPSGT